MKNHGKIHDIKAIALLIPPRNGQKSVESGTSASGRNQRAIHGAIEMARCMNARLCICCPEKDIRGVEDLLVQSRDEIRELPIIQLEGIRPWRVRRGKTSLSRAQDFQEFFSQALRFVGEHSVDLVILPVSQKNVRMVCRVMAELIQQTLTGEEQDASVA